jgi:hypothetical protein
VTKEPLIFHKYTLGKDVSGTDHLGAFDLCLTSKPSQDTLSSPSTPMSSPHLYNNQINIVEVKDLRQTVAIEIKYVDTNAGMEWTKYSVHTLGVIVTSGKPESQVVPFPLDSPQIHMECIA